MLTGTASYEALEEELIFTCSKNKERAAYLAKFPFLPFVIIIFSQLIYWLGAQHTPCTLTAHVFCPPFTLEHRWTRTQIGS